MTKPSNILPVQLIPDAFEIGTPRIKVKYYMRCVNDQPDAQFL